MRRRGRMNSEPACLRLCALRHRIGMATHAPCAPSPTHRMCPRTSTRLSPSRPHCELSHAHTPAHGPAHVPAVRMPRADRRGAERAARHALVSPLRGGDSLRGLRVLRDRLGRWGAGHEPVLATCCSSPAPRRSSRRAGRARHEPPTALYWVPITSAGLRRAPPASAGLRRPPPAPAGLR